MPTKMPEQELVWIIPDRKICLAKASKFEFRGKTYYCASDGYIHEDSLVFKSRKDAADFVYCLYQQDATICRGTLREKGYLAHMEDLEFLEKYPVTPGRASLLLFYEKVSGKVVVDGIDCVKVAECNIGGEVKAAIRFIALPEDLEEFFRINESTSLLVDYSYKGGVPIFFFNYDMLMEIARLGCKNG